jgi:hypothetical protein
VHGDTIELFVERGYEGYNFDAGILPKKMQRPGAILSTRPGEGYPPLFSHVTISIGQL